MRFFDASALVKRYIREAHTARVQRWLAGGGAVVSRLSEVEVASAFARLNRDGFIDTPERDRALTAFHADMAEWHIVEIAPEVTVRARTLLIRHAIRAGDAIQLGSALYLQQMVDQPLELFAVFDARLADAARLEGLKVP